MLYMLGAGALPANAEVYGLHSSEFQSSELSAPESGPQVKANVADEIHSLLAEDRSLGTNSWWVPLALLECPRMCFGKVSAELLLSGPVIWCSHLCLLVCIAQALPVAALQYIPTIIPCRQSCIYCMCLGTRLCG